MPIDASIPLQAKNIQIESPVNQLAMMGEAMKIGEMGRSVEEQNRLNEYLRSGADLSKPETRRELIKYGKTGLAYGKALNEQDLSAANLKKTTAEISLKDMEIAREGYKNLMFNPSPINFAAHLEDAVKSGKMTPAQAQQEYQTVLSLNEAQRLDYVRNRALKAEQYFSDLTSRRGQDISASTTRRGQDLANNPELQGQIETAKVLGKARGEEATAPFKDIQANVKALKSAGYNPETGEDTISGLIQKSTGSFVGAGTDLAARTVGISTGGAKAIASLKTYESKLTQDLLGGKMGAGISNADRDFIVAGIGQIADPTLPVETRQAAWNSVKERMRVAGMVPAPKGEASPENGSPALPPGFVPDKK